MAWTRFHEKEKKTIKKSKIIVLFGYLPRCFLLCPVDEISAAPWEPQGCCIWWRHRATSYISHILSETFDLEVYSFFGVMGGGDRSEWVGRWRFICTERLNFIRTWHLFTTLYRFIFVVFLLFCFFCFVRFFLSLLLFSFWLFVWFFLPFIFTFFLCAWVYMCMHTCVYVCVCMYVYMCMHTCVYTCAIFNVLLFSRCCMLKCTGNEYKSKELEGTQSSS